MKKCNPTKMFVLRDGEYESMHPTSLAGERTLEADLKGQLRAALADELEILSIAKESRFSRVGCDFADQIGITDQGQLVIVEYKCHKAEAPAFDQLHKYLLYARSLGTLEIVGLASDFYAAEGWPRAEAEQDICKFTGQPDPDRLSLNTSKQPKGVLIAEDFSDPVYHLVSEVYPHVQIDLYCLQLWRCGGEITCTLDKVFPSEPAKMDGTRCTKRLGRDTPDRSETYVRFWSMLMAAFQSAGLDKFVNREPAKGPKMLRFWNGKEGVGHVLILDLSEAAVGMYFPKSQYVLAALYKRRERIHERLGHELEWRMEVNQFGIYREASINCESNWGEIIAWMLETFQRFEAAVDPELKDILSGS